MSCAMDEVRLMKKKPDLLWVLALVYALSMAIGNYLPPWQSPELVAQNYITSQKVPSFQSLPR